MLSILKWIWNSGCFFTIIRSDTSINDFNYRKLTFCSVQDKHTWHLQIYNAVQLSYLAPLCKFLIALRKIKMIYFVQLTDITTVQWSVQSSIIFKTVFSFYYILLMIRLTMGL